MRVGNAAVGAPTLHAAEDKLIAVGAGAGVHAAGSEPWSGSVKPKQPIACPAAIAGSHRCFCASEPNA